MAKLGIDLSASLEGERIEKEEQEAAENEEFFYETIEAPKFVDFTAPDHYRPDDRYWFCSRVGCDRKHEEELDSERIYKDFVLRAMAARSPNVRLHKALNRDCSSKAVKCPLSVPAKSSKSRLSRLAVISSISLKMDEKKERAKPVSKVCPTTPKEKGKQVAAKYLTTPRNKKISSDRNGNGFRSVQNAAKPANLVVPKPRVVAKALAFPSPKKAFNMKSSVELRTPLTKLCQKMKKLEVTSQRKPALPLKSSNNDKCRRKIPGKSIIRPVKQDVEGKKNKGKLIGCAKETEAETACEISKQTDRASDVKGIAQASLGCQENSEKIPSEYVASHVEGSENEEMHNDDKENVNTTAFDENRSFSSKNDNSGREILGIKKVTQATTKNGATGLKQMKLKTTNPKPFKLRTYERGILRETNLERRNHAIDSQKEAALASTTQKGITGPRCAKREAKSKANSKQELKHTTTFESSKEKSSAARVLQPRKTLNVTSEAMTPDKANSTPKKTGMQCKKVNKVPANSPGSLPRGRRILTVPKEPNFHSSRKPKSCAGKSS